MQPPSVKACCADLYHSDLARLVLGDTLHPGGLALTNRLGRLLGIQPGDWVVDLAAGRGVSAAALSRVFRCKVVGIEFGAQAVAEALAISVESLFPSQTFFLRGDAERPPLRRSSVEHVICECSMSIFPDKPCAVSQVLQVLRPGGTLGISDVTLRPGSLPEELSGVVGRALCLADALDIGGYVRLLENSGFALLHQEDASTAILDLLDGLESRLGALLGWQEISGPGETWGTDLIQNAPSLITRLRELLGQGQLGYWLFVAQKPL